MIRCATDGTKDKPRVYLVIRIVEHDSSDTVSVWPTFEGAFDEARRLSNAEDKGQDVWFEVYSMKLSGTSGA